jgi:hypothetical protein
MKLLVSLAMLAIAFMLSACAPKLDQARTGFCKDLGAYMKAVASAGELGPDSTVAEFNKTQKDVDAAYKKLERSANRLSDAQSAAIKKVNQTFEKTVNDIKGNEKLGTAAQSVAQASAQAMSQYSDIASTTCAYGASDETTKM